MNPSENCYVLIKQFEGCRLIAYQDAVGIWTIGYGNTDYEDGTKVKQADHISQERAEQLLHHKADGFAIKVNGVTMPVAQNKFDSLVSFAYNVGFENYRKSTLLKKVNTNPADTTIRDEFMKWNKARKNGELIVLPGLTNRRKKEADHYFLPQ